MRASLNERSLQSIILESVSGESGPQEKVEEESRGGEGIALSASHDTSSPVIHMVNQTNAQEIVYYVLSKDPGEPPFPAPEPSQGASWKSLRE